MSIMQKALKVAGQMTRQGNLTDATATIRAALAGLAGAKADDKGTSSEVGTPSSFCMARPSPMPDLGALRRGRFQARATSSPAGAEPETGGTRFFARSIAGSWGLRSYKLFVPAADKPHGLIVMLHGCTQNPGRFRAGSG